MAQLLPQAALSLWVGLHLLPMGPPPILGNQPRQDQLLLEAGYCRPEA
jgi:hypothetical protein